MMWITTTSDTIPTRTAEFFTPCPGLTHVTLCDYQPLLDSERVLTHQQDTLAESRGLVGIHLVAVYKAIGGGWQTQQ